MTIARITRTCAVALVLALTATGLWAAGADEEGAAAADDKKYVTDPTTGKVVVAPQYGGTFIATRRSDPAGFRRLLRTSYKRCYRVRVRAAGQSRLGSR